ncbi:MAG TPA: glycosyltransferase family 9 protein [Candidatus Hydrogenedentes bacterium]|nr:glycosyltransferase family 9 protein [Candidatus Hydrogenedentota bacterium]
MRILALQIARMGDVIQTSPMVRALRVRHPDAHIAMMVRPMGLAAAQHNPDLNEVLVYDEDELFLDIRVKDSDRLLQAYRRMEQYIEMIRNGRFDAVYNCTHSLPSAMLIKLAGIPTVVGAHLSDDGQFVLRGRWTTHFFTSVLHREFNDLNLCDLMRLLVEDAPPAQELVLRPKDQDRAFAEALLHEHGVTPDAFVACFQLGASEENKRWPVAQFAGLARLLVARPNTRIFLLGVKDEAPLGNAFEEFAPGIATPLFGKTTIPQAAALLERADVLVTNDTGTMHIAAAARCPVVLVSVGWVHFRETGPYGDGHFAIERRRTLLGHAQTRESAPENAESVRPEQVLRVMDWAMHYRANPETPLSAEDSLMDQVDVHIARFAPDTCLEWYPALRRPLAERDLIRLAYRYMWLDFLSELTPAREQESLRRLLLCYSPESGGEAQALAARQQPALKNLAQKAEEGIDTTKRLLTALDTKEVKKAQERVERLMRLDEETRILGELHEICKPIVLTARFERDNLEGANPNILAQTTLRIYQDMQAQTRLLQQKLDTVERFWKENRGNLS